MSITVCNLTTGRLIPAISNVCVISYQNSLLARSKPAYVIPGKMSRLNDLQFTAGLKSKCLLYLLARRDEMTWFECTLEDFGSSATSHALLSPWTCQNQATETGKPCFFSSKKANDGAPFSSVCRAGDPSTEALSSLQRPRVRLPAWGPLPLPPSLSSCFLSHLQLISQ